MCTVASVFQIMKHTGFYAQVTYKAMEFNFQLLPKREGGSNFSTLKNVGRGTVVGIAT
jgi:hypothetical protein